MANSYPYITCFLILFLFTGCFGSSDHPTSGDDNTGSNSTEERAASDSLDPGIPDDYSNIAHISNFDKWGSHNVHDPALIKHDDTYYMYSTDVYYGGAEVPHGDHRLNPKIPIRKSKDLVHWKPIGHVFEHMPSEIIEWMRQIQPTYKPEAVWAPYIVSFEDQYRLYFSVPANNGLQTAYLGLAVSSHPEGPWEHKGLIIPTHEGSSYNGIDPAVIIDHKNGKHWLFFGSWWDGIHVVELNPENGFRKDEDDYGTIVASRNPDWFGSSPMEGAEVLYHPGRDQYYMFVSYDLLMEEYNVRVGRSDQPEGPYYDYFGREFSQPTDNFPRITAQYRFDNHPGWQGIGHTGLLRDGEAYFLATQGRLGSTEPTIHLMNLHLRKMIWTKDGWPSLSPQRYAAVPGHEIKKEDITGSWEIIVLKEIGEKNTAKILSLKADNTLTGYYRGAWVFNNAKLTLNLTGGEELIVEVMWGWDWENSQLSLLFTGLNSEGIGVWGKHKMKSPDTF